MNYLGWWGMTLLFEYLDNSEWRPNVGLNPDYREEVNWHIHLGPDVQCSALPSLPLTDHQSLSAPICPESCPSSSCDTCLNILHFCQNLPPSAWQSNATSEPWHWHHMVKTSHGPPVTFSSAVVLVWSSYDSITWIMAWEIITVATFL